MEAQSYSGGVGVVVVDVDVVTVVVVELMICVAVGWHSLPADFVVVARRAGSNGRAGRVDVAMISDRSLVIAPTR